MLKIIKHNWVNRVFGIPGFADSVLPYPQLTEEYKSVVVWNQSYTDQG